MTEFKEQFEYDLEDSETIKQCQFEWNIQESLKNIIPEIPQNLMSTLQLYTSNLGGISRKLDKPYIEEHQKAYGILRKRIEIIDDIINYLSDLNKTNLEIAGCLRNTYKPPYDPESLIDAWNYSAFLQGYRECDKKYYIDNKDKLEKAYNYWLNIFSVVTKDTNAVFKNFGQYKDCTRGYIIFYVPNIIGEFHVTFPQNIHIDFGNRDEYDDMMMSISYSYPGNHGCIMFDKCLDFDTICKSYSLEELNKIFLDKVNNNSKTQEFKTEQYYIDKCKKDFIEYYDKEGYKKDPRASFNKDIIDSYLNYMREYKCSVIDTKPYKENLERILKDIRKATYGEDKK